MDEQQAAMFPDNIPEQVVLYFQAVERWFASGTHKSPTRDELVKKFQPEISTRSLDRIRRKYASLIGRWPPKRGDRPPWQSASDNGHVRSLDLNVVQDEIHHLNRVRMTAFDEEGNPVVITQYYDSLTNRLVDTIIERFHGLAAVAAGIFIYGVLDWLSDGKFDGVVCLLGLLGCPATA